MIVVVVFLSLFAAIHAGCPIHCSCSKNTINCMSRHLAYVPFFEDISQNPQIIDLSGNSISYVDSFSFDKSDQVLEIYMNSSELASIEEKAFDELENLQELYLADNFLSSLPERFIQNNEHLIILDLSQNHFMDLPIIKSESLEVLAIANSGIERIEDNSLQGLPNLRILYIQQNNLKTISPGIFDGMQFFYYVKLTPNPWQCTCKTIKLFQYLSDKGVVDLNEATQCQTENKDFVDIYKNGFLAPEFRDQCAGLETDPSEVWLLQMRLAGRDNSNEETADDEDDFYPEVSKEDLNEIDYFTSLFFSIVLCVAVVVSLLVGAVFGSCVTHRFMSRNVSPTPSLKELIPRTNAFAVV